MLKLQIVIFNKDIQEKKYEKEPVYIKNVLYLTSYYTADMWLSEATGPKSHTIIM